MRNDQREIKKIENLSIRKLLGELHTHQDATEGIIERLTDVIIKQEEWRKVIPSGREQNPLPPKERIDYPPIEYTHLLVGVIKIDDKISYIRLADGVLSYSAFVQSVEQMIERYGLGIKDWDKLYRNLQQAYRGLVDYLGRLVIGEGGYGFDIGNLFFTIYTEYHNYIVDKGAL